MPQREGGFSQLLRPIKLGGWIETGNRRTRTGERTDARQGATNTAPTDCSQRNGAEQNDTVATRKNGQVSASGASRLAGSRLAGG